MRAYTAHEVMVHLFLVRRVECVLQAVIVPDYFDGCQIEVLGFYLGNRVYCHGFGEFGAAFFRVRRSFVRGLAVALLSLFVVISGGR